MSDNDEAGTLHGTCEATVVLTADGASVTLSIESHQIAKLYLIEGEAPDDALDVLADRIKIVLRRRWAMSIKGRA